MTNPGYIRVTPSFFQAYDDAITVLRMYAKAGGKEADEALYGLLAYATAIEEASRAAQPVRQINESEVAS